jgi:hypothetical protein
MEEKRPDLDTYASNLEWAEIGRVVTCGILLFLPWVEGGLQVTGLLLHSDKLFRTDVLFGYIILIATAIVFMIALPIAVGLKDVCEMMDVQEVDPYDIIGTQLAADMLVSTLLNNSALDSMNLTATIVSINAVDMSVAESFDPNSLDADNFAFATDVEALDASAYYHQSDIDSYLSTLNSETSGSFNEETVYDCDPADYGGSEATVSEFKWKAIQEIELKAALTDNFAAAVAHDVLTEFNDLVTIVDESPGVTAPDVQVDTRGLYDVSFMGEIGVSYAELKYSLCDSVAVDSASLCFVIWLMMILQPFIIWLDVVEVMRNEHHLTMAERIVLIKQGKASIDTDGNIKDLKHASKEDVEAAKHSQERIAHRTATMKMNNMPVVPERPAHITENPAPEPPATDSGATNA